jgi:hypothetical protein
MTTKRRTTADDLEQQQKQEWSTYVAKVAIDFYGVRAFNPGDPVPASAVDGADGWVSPDYVDKRATPFEGSPTVVPPEAPAIDPATVAAPASSTPTPEG